MSLEKIKDSISKHKNVVSNLAKPGKDILKVLVESDCHILHMAVGISGEAGEILSVTGDVDFDTGGELDIKNLVEELGDIKFYLRGLKDALGVEIEYDLMPMITLTEFDMKPIYDQTVKSSYITIDSLKARALERFSKMLSINSADILDQVKKFVIYRKPINFDKLNQAIAGAEHYIKQIYAVVGVSAEDVLDYNCEKLAGKNGRYKSGTYSDSAAIKREDKEGHENNDVQN